MRFSFLTAWIFLGFAGFYLWETAHIRLRVVPGDPGVRAIPWLFGSILLALALIQAILEWRRGSGPADWHFGELKPQLAIVGLLGLYLLTMTSLGFFVSTALAASALGWFLRRPQTWGQRVVVVAFGSGLALGLLLVFGNIFAVYLPPGLWWEAIRP